MKTGAFSVLRVRSLKLLFACIAGTVILDIVCCLLISFPPTRKFIMVFFHERSKTVKHPNLFTIPAEIAAEEEAFRLGNTQFQKFIANLTIPFPFLLLILSAAYLILLGSIYWIYYSVQKKRVRGVTRPSTGGLKPFTCCPCCLSFVDACNCCRMTSLDACLNGLCPQRKSHDCADILFCQACIGRPGHLKKSVKLIRCPFPCQSDYCENTTLCCFYCEFRSAPQLLEET